MIEFRTVTNNCIPLLIKWLNTCHVKEYWDNDITYTDEMLIQKYKRRIEEEKVKMYIIVLNGKDIGYIQSYEPDEKELANYNVIENCRGIDLYIGEETLIGKGIGTRALKSFINEYIFSNKDYELVCLDPEVRNLRAIRSYEKVGFKHIVTKLDNDSKLLTYYMLLNKKQFLDNYR